MPLYDYKCNECGKTFEHTASYLDRVVESPCCPNALARRVVSVGGVYPFGVQQFEDLHIDGNLKNITSKEQLARECHKAGVYSNMLRGSDKYERMMRGEY